MRALPEILWQRPNAHCLIVGKDHISYDSPPKAGGNWRQVMLAEMGKQLPMERVHFLGGLSYQDYLRVIQISSCHVYLTYPFVLSWSCLEAMSAGRVVVASNTAPVQEVIEHGVNGLLFDFFDVAALSKQVIDVLDDPESYRHLGIGARQSVLDRYDLQTKCLPAQINLIAGPASCPTGINPKQFQAPNNGFTFKTATAQRADLQLLSGDVGSAIAIAYGHHRPNTL